MRRFDSFKIAIIIFQLLLLCDIEVDGKLSTFTLLKRTDSGINANEGRRSEALYPQTLLFDQLHNGYFQHRPNPTALSPVDAERMYPETYFLEGHPVFFTDFRNPLSRNELHRAFDLFGKVHVVDTDTERFLTIRPESIRPGQLEGFNRYDIDLKPFFHRVRSAEETYGQTVARVLLGPEILRLPTDIRDRIPRYRDQVHWRTIRAAQPLADDPLRTAEDLRQRLRQHKFLKVDSLDGRDSLNLRFDTDVTVQKLSQGDVDSNVADVLRNSVGTLVNPF